MEVWILWVCISFANLSGTSCQTAIKSEMDMNQCFASLSKIPTKTNTMIPVAICYKKEK